MDPQLIRVWDCLGIVDEKDSILLNLDIKILVVPLQARQQTLKILHISHQGYKQDIHSCKDKLLLANTKRGLPTNDSILHSIQRTEP